MQKPVERNWVDVLLQEMASGKKYKRLIQKCINNMGGQKKLYKYYDVNSPYTLPNLESTENYYRDPTEFNDPFDCNVGISADQLIRMCLPGMYEQLEGASLDPDVRRMIETVMFGGNDTHDEGSDEAIIAALLDAPDFADIIYKAQMGESIDEGVLASVLLNNPKILALMIKKYPGLKVQGDGPIKEEQVVRVATQSANFVRQMLKKTEGDQNEKAKAIISIMSEDGDLLGRIQKIARLFGYADQSDQIDQLYDKLEIAVDQIHTQLGASIGITCFSETPNNMLMWSHYANKHTGICVEYDFSRIFSSAPDTLLLPVTYTKKRPLFPIDQVVLGPNGKPVENQKYSPDMFADFLKVLTVKSDIWSYEHEWRHIISAKTEQSRLVKLPIISKIIMGINISPENREKVIEIGRKKGIPVYSTKMRADKYEMVIADTPE